MEGGYYQLAVLVFIGYLYEGTPNGARLHTERRKDDDARTLNILTFPCTEEIVAKNVVKNKNYLNFFFFFFFHPHLSLYPPVFQGYVFILEGMESSASFNLNGYRPNGDFFTFSFLPTTKRGEKNIYIYIYFFFDLLLYSPPLLLILFRRLYAACVACVGCALYSPLTTLSHLVGSPAVAERLERGNCGPVIAQRAHTHTHAQ